MKRIVHANFRNFGWADTKIKADIMVIKQCLGGKEDLINIMHNTIVSVAGIDQIQFIVEIRVLFGGPPIFFGVSCPPTYPFLLHFYERIFGNFGNSEFYVRHFFRKK